MARASTVSDGEKAKAAQLNAVVNDYVSQTDTTEQDMASDLQYASGKRPNFGFEGTGSGTSPITVPHGLGSTPATVFVSVNALQPYTVAYNADDTNVYVYHNAMGSLTVSVRAVL